jgi:hypothetical protein
MAAVGGVVNMIVGAIQFSVSGGMGAAMSQIPPEALRSLEDAGIDPSSFGSIGAVLGIGAVCCVAGLVLAAVLGAVGGAIMASVKPD